MLNVHQPYIKRTKYYCALAGIGVLLLGSLIIGNSFSESGEVFAAEIKYMQQFTNPICQSMSEGDTMDLIDPRGESEEDFQTYTIVKLKDNRCWMQENLRLTLTASGLSPTNSDIISEWNDSSTIKPRATQLSTATSWTNDSTAVISRTGTMIYGNYYSWCAATAGTCNMAVTDGATASGSICPKGWRLPSGGGSDTKDTGDFRVLNGLTGKLVQQSPYLFRAAGYPHVIEGGLIFVGSNGAYWSRTASASTNAYEMVFIGDTLYPGTRSSSRAAGCSVRCIADNTVTESDFTYGDIEWEESTDGDVNVNVPSILTIDAVSSFEDTMPESNLLEGSISATIFSNTEYNVMLNANTDAALVSEENNRIEPVSDSNEVKAGNNAWGFWDGDSNPKLYTVPLSTSMTEIPNAESNGENDSTIHTYYLGISIAPSLPSGVYATDVTVTASVK